MGRGPFVSCIAMFPCLPNFFLTESTHRAIFLIMDKCSYWRKILYLIIALLCVLAVFIACAGEDTAPAPESVPLTFVPEDWVDKTIGVITGTIHDQVIADFIPGAVPAYFNDLPSSIVALRNHQINGVLTDIEGFKVYSPKNPGLRALEPYFDDSSAGMLVSKEKLELLEKLNDFIALINADGTYDEMYGRWIGGDETMPQIPEGTGELLRFATSGVVDGFAYYKDGEIAGLDVEFAKRFAAHENMRLEISVMDFSGLLPALQSGKVDYAACCFAITEERAQSANYTDPYFTTARAIAVYDATAAQLTLDDIDLEKADIGIMTGSTGEMYIEANYPGAGLYRYDSVPDAVMALKSNHLDYVITAYTIALGFVRSNPDLAIIPGTLLEEGVAIAIKKDDTQLLNDISAVLDQFKADGTLDDIIDRWIKEDGSAYEQKEIPVHTDAPVLMVGVAANREPMCYIDSGKIVGLDAELIERIAYELGMRVEYMDMQFSALITALESSRVSVVISNVTATEERREKVNFTDDYFQNPQVLLGQKDEVMEGTDESLWDSLMTAIERNLIQEDRWKLIVDGLGVSLTITLLAFALATLLGFGVCGLRMSKNVILKAIGDTYVAILRGTPIVVLLMITFYVIFAQSTISGTMVAVIAFGANGAAFIGEILRSAILTIDKGQIEAARSMGFGKVGAFFTVTFPQAVRVAFPVYMSEFISLFKMTSVVGYIAIIDLTKAGDIIRSRTYDAFFPLIIVALVYLTVASLMIYLFNCISRRTDKRLRRAAQGGSSADH